MADEKRPDYDIEALIALVRWLNGIDDSKTLARKLADVGEKVSAWTDSNRRPPAPQAGAHVP